MTLCASSSTGLATVFFLTATPGEGAALPLRLAATTVVSPPTTSEGRDNCLAKSLGRSPVELRCTPAAPLGDAAEEDAAAAGEFFLLTLPAFPDADGGRGGKALDEDREEGD